MEEGEWDERFGRMSNVEEWQRNGEKLQLVKESVKGDYRKKESKKWRNRREQGLG